MALRLEQMADIAEFFRRAPGETLKGEALDQDFYGIGLMAGRFPQVQDEINSIAWSWGAKVINDDGTPAPAAARWALKLPPDGAVSEAIAFLRGLFFIEPGHYRTIVFILQDQPFAQDDKPASEQQARAWISRGANIISPDLGQKSYAGAHCTALIYEFASDGASVKLVDGGLTGKEHLARSGLLAALEPAR